MKAGQFVPRLRFLPSIVLAGSLLGTGLFWWTQADRNAQISAAAIGHEIKELRDVIATRINIYEGILRAAQSLFMASDYVSADEWRRFSLVQAQKGRYPGIDGLFYVARTQRRDIPGFISAQKKEYSDFSLSFLNDGALSKGIPAGDKELFVVTRVEPKEQYGAALGVDYGSDPVKREAIEKALAATAPALSGSVAPLPGSPERLLFFVPVYADGVVPSSAEKRRDLALGLVGVMIRMDLAMDSIFKAEKDVLWAKVYDGETPSDAALLYDGEEASDIDTYQSVTTSPQTISFDLTDRVWSLSVSLALDQVHFSSGIRAYFVPLLGGVLSFALWLAARLLISGRARALSLAEKMARLSKESEERLVNAQMIARIGNWERDLATGRYRWSEETFRIFGLPPGTKACQETLKSVVHPEDWEELMGRLGQVMNEGIPDNFEFRILSPDEMTRHVHVFAGVVRGEDGKAIRLSGTIQDISERKWADEAIKKSEKQFRRLVESANMIAWEATMHNTHFNYVSPHAENLFGYPMEDWYAENFWVEHIHLDDREYVVQYSRAAASRGEDHDFEYRMIAADGSSVWVRDIVSVQANPRGPNSLRGFMIDISDQKQEEEAIWRKANYDGLTNLPNRAMGMDRLLRAMARARRSDVMAAVLFIDLDGFKEINDTMGHEAGDILLVEASKRLSACARETDTVARHGGDEFLIVLNEIPEELMATHVAEKVLDAMRSPFDLDGREVTISCSIGVSLYPKHGDKTEVLIGLADMAMYAVKASGKDGLRFADKKHLGSD
jgi:diguanylate cyclase (GGDEF)-like protein/PAS domain S-box-containing protein